MFDLEYHNTLKYIHEFNTYIKDLGYACHITLDVMRMFSKITKNEKVNISPYIFSYDKMEYIQINNKLNCVFWCPASYIFNYIKKNNFEIDFPTETLTTEKSIVVFLKNENISVAIINYKQKHGVKIFFENECPICMENIDLDPNPPSISYNRRKLFHCQKCSFVTCVKCYKRLQRCPQCNKLFT